MSARPRPGLIGAVVVGVVMVAFVVVLATREPAGERRVSSPLVGKPAPALTGGTLTGGTFDLTRFEGQWVVVNFFATWCVPCQREHPELRSFAEAHARTGDAQVVSVVFDDDPDQVARFFEERGGDWPVLADDDSSILTGWGVAGVPESYIVDPGGVVRAKIISGVTEAQLDGILADLGGPGA